MKKKMFSCYSSTHTPIPTSSFISLSLSLSLFSLFFFFLCSASFSKTPLFYQFPTRLSLLLVDILFSFNHYLALLERELKGEAAAERLLVRVGGLIIPKLNASLVRPLAT